MKTKMTLWTLVAITVLCSCNTDVNQRQYSASEIAYDSEIFNQPPVDNVKIQTERKVIKEGEIIFETSDLKKTESLVADMVSTMGGYIANDNITRNEEKITHRTSVRVPAENFDRLLDKISESADKLDSKTISVLDVTEEFIDIQARIKTKKELENRYKELLAKANTVEELLSIEKELGTLRTEIESIEGRLKYLQDRVSLSSLTIEYYELTTSSFRFIPKLGKSFVTGWNWFLSFIVGLVHMWPFIVLFVAALIISLRINRKKKKTKNAV